MKDKNAASRACQIMTSIRCREEIKYSEIVQVLKKEIIFDDNRHKKYFLCFFENCRIPLIKQFMNEQGISKQQIMDVFARLANFGELYRFRQAVANGEF